MSSKKIQIGRKLSFAGYVVSPDGVHADPEKTEAVSNFPTPTSVRDVRSFLGLANQLGSFLPDLAILTTPLRLLLRKDTAWTWEQPQVAAFKAVKQALTTLPPAHFYDQSLPTRMPPSYTAWGLSLRSGWPMASRL